MGVLVRGYGVLLAGHPVYQNVLRLPIVVGIGVALQSVETIPFQTDLFLKKISRTGCSMVHWFCQAVLWLAIGCFMLPTNGCALGKQKKLVPESLATCRELARDGVSAMEMGEWERACELLHQAVEASPSDLDARRSLAEALWQNGSYRDAVVHMEAAVRLDPRHAPTVVRAGEMMLAIGAVERAREHAIEALELDPHLGGAWALRGRVYRQQGELVRALADLQNSLRFAPQHNDTLLEVAQIYYEMERPQRSLSTLHHLMDSFPPGEEPRQVLWLQGLAYGDVGRHLDAVECLQAASDRGQPAPELLYQLARAEQAVGRHDSAAETLHQALALDASHEPSRMMLAQLQRHDSSGHEQVIRR